MWEGKRSLAFETGNLCAAKVEGETLAKKLSLHWLPPRGSGYSLGTLCFGCASSHPLDHVKFDDVRVMFSVCT